MFVVFLDYVVPLSVMETYLVAHRVHLDEGYKMQVFIASGPKIPRDGGVILSQLTNRQELDLWLEKDPFHIHGIATYTVIAFDPVKYHPDFSPFVNI